MRKNLLTMVLLVAGMTAWAQEPVQMGKGSYAAYAPLSVSHSSSHSGDQSQYMQYRELYINEQAGVPIPTNDWWTDLINADRERTGQELTGHLWSYPQYVQGMKYGLDIHYPKYWIDNGTEMKAQSKLTVRCGDDFTPTHPQAESWSDWMVTFSEKSGTKQLLTTLMHGVPFTWIETNGLQPVVSAEATGNDGDDNLLKGSVSVSFTDGNGQTLSSGTYQQFVVKISNSATSDLYGVYLPEGTTVTIDGSRATLAFGGSRQFLVVALLQSASDLTAFAQYAYSKPTDTRVSWGYKNSKLTTQWAVSAQDLRTGSSTSKVLQGQIPHHYRTPYASYNHSFLSQTYLTPRGRLKLVASNNISISYRFSGMLPWYPQPAKADNGSQTTDNGDWDESKMLQMLQRYAETGEFGADTYWGGKGLTQMALNMTFAREMGNEALFRQCHDRLKEALVNWLTYTPGEENFFFARDNRYGGLIGYATSYDSETYNDHHFHYGYFTLAAALLALVDDDFRVNYGDMIRLVARDYNNYKRDSWACFLRMMDPWAGHCYAGGMGDGAGNGQESTSESMQGWGGMYLLGVALRDDELRDAGIFGWVLESRATAEYWFDRHGETIDGSFHTTKNDDYNIDYSKFRHTNPDYVIPYSSNLTSHGVGWWTWFGGDPVYMQGIQWMPISPALDYLGEDKAFAAWDYERLMELMEHVGWTDYSGSSAWLGNSDWGNVVLSYLQWSDPDEAARIFDEGWSRGWPTMTTSSTNGISYFVTHSHRTYGDIQWDVTANLPTARVYKKGTKTYHVAYNPYDSPVTVSYSDGVSFSVPARQMKVKERDYVSVTMVYPEDATADDLRERLFMKNLALHKTCTASSEENASCLVANATDGDQTTRWGSKHQDGQWICVDLGETVSIYSVKIHWESAYASEYELWLSTDGSTFTKVKTCTSSGGWDEVKMDDMNGRYVKLLGTKRGTDYGVSLYELEVYGRPASASDNDLMGVEITCDKAVLKQGVPTELHIKGYSYAGNEKTVNAEWSSNDGTFDGNVFTPTNYGNVTVTAVVRTTDNGQQTTGLTATKTLAVEEGLVLTSLSLTLNGEAIIGQPVPFTAKGLDQFGAPYATTLSYELYEMDNGPQTTDNGLLDTQNMTFTAFKAGTYAIVVSAGSLSQTVYVEGIGPSGLTYAEIPAVQAAPSMSGKLPLFVGSTVPNMNFTYNGGSKKGSDNFPVPTIGGGTTRSLFVSQLGTFGFGALGNLDISGYNMIHADVYVNGQQTAPPGGSDDVQFAFHFEGQPTNKVYAKTLTRGQWNSVDLPITNTTVNWLFFAFSDYQSGTDEALVANVYFYKETGDKVFVSDPDAKGLVTVTSFGTGITDSNVSQFLNDVAALPATATAIDLSGIALTNSTPMTISTPNNPNTVIILSGSGGDNDAASEQQAKLTNSQNLVYNSGGWHLPLKATGYRLTFTDGYPVYPVNYGGKAVFSYTRTLAAGAYGSMCLPRELTIPTGITAYELTDVTSTSIGFTKVAGSTLTAYKPYLLRNTNSTAATLSISSVQGNVELGRTTSELTTTVGGVRFTGNFQQFRVKGTEGYAAFKSSGQLAWLNNAGTTVGSFRAYLADVTEAQAVGMLIDGQQTTDNRQVTSDKRQVISDNESWYSLDGRKLSGKPTTTGIYIVNGKKVVIK